MTAKSLCAAAAAVALGLAACGDDEDEETAGTTTTTETQAEEARSTAGPVSEIVSLTETEFAIDPAERAVAYAGVVEFKVENAGSTTHALEVEGGGIEEETEEISAGETATLKVDLPKGSYELYCPIGDHADQGMTAELTVGGGESGALFDARPGNDDSGGAEAPESGDDSGGAEAPESGDDSGGAEAPSGY